MFGLFQRKPQAYGDLSPTEVKSRLDDGSLRQLVDVRSPGEFAQGHIAQARLIPLGDLPNRYGELDNGQDVVLYCLSAARSRRAAQFLAGLGFERVYNMEGGVSRWPFGLKR